MPDDLEERLRAHARSLDGLLSLTPAKLYSGEDNSDQWKRKKQTPEERRAARKAKLDPDNWKSAKDVLDERAAAAILKRKREEERATNNEDGPSAEQESENQKLKKRKTDSSARENESGTTKSSQEQPETEEQRRQHKKEQKVAKRARKQARKEKERQKKEKLKAKKKTKSQEHHLSDEARAMQDSGDALEGEIQDENKIELGSRAREDKRIVERKEKAHENRLPKDRPAEESASSSEHAESSELDESEEETPEPIRVEKMATASSHKPGSKNDQNLSATSSEGEGSPILSPHLNSATSSISSIQPPTIPETKSEIFEEHSQLQPQHQHSTLPKDDDRNPRERLEARISQLRAERKADGPDGRPARNRQELLDQRRRKEEQRRAAKKEQRRKEKEEERRKEDEEIAKRFSPGGSGSLLASPRSPVVDSGNDFTFGRVAFGDGTQADASLSSILDHRKKKGPSDAASALKAAQNKASRLAGLDEAKRSTIEEQDMWLNAKRKAHGERVRDDTSLLKKALKRKEGERRRSEKEWQRREEGVRLGMEKKQQRREENIQKRRDEKNERKVGKKNPKKVRRPGFEGSFRGRTGGKKTKSS